MMRNEASSLRMRSCNSTFNNQPPSTEHWIVLEVLYQVGNIDSPKVTTKPKFSQYTGTGVSTVYYVIYSLQATLRSAY